MLMLSVVDLQTIEAMDVASPGPPATPPAAPPATSQEDLLSNVLIIIMPNLCYISVERVKELEQLSNPQSVCISLSAYRIDIASDFLNNWEGERTRRPPIR